MEQALKLAIEGGFIPKGFFMIKNPVKVGVKDNVIFAEGKPTEDGWSGGRETMHIKELIKNPLFLLEPLFWKGMDTIIVWKSEAGNYYDDNAWQEKWHLFIDHLAEGKSIDSFFDNLLNK